MIQVQVSSVSLCQEGPSKAAWRSLASETRKHAAEELRVRSLWRLGLILNATAMIASADQGKAPSERQQVPALCDINPRAWLDSIKTISPDCLSELAKAGEFFATLYETLLRLHATACPGPGRTFFDAEKLVPDCSTFVASDSNSRVNCPLRILALVVPLQ